jgi:hypothetical protein
MMSFFIIFVTLTTFANPTWKWSHALKVVERHEFYLNNEVIIRPKNTWQTLFGVLYRDSNLVTYKDCLYYQVPGDGPGILKLKTVPVNKKCEKFVFSQADKEWKDLKALQFTIENNSLIVGLTFKDFQLEKWEIPLFNAFKRPTPKGLMSSAEYRSPRFTFLSPYKGMLSVRPQKAPPLKDKMVCHDIDEDCQEKSPSVCTQCENGWYEIPNGCSQGPKYCGQSYCGSKNRPACRRGMKYQLKTEGFKCREDQSFAYCAKGLHIQCHGEIPYCQ